MPGLTHSDSSTVVFRSRVGGDMNRFASPLLRLLDRVSAPERVSAHCDIPCGIYDPHAPQTSALTGVRMTQLSAGLQVPTLDAPADQRVVFLNSFARYVATKESHAESCKRELD